MNFKKGLVGLLCIVVLGLALVVPHSVNVDAKPKKAKTITVNASAYSYKQKGMGHITSKGINLKKHSRVIAVDPKIIRLGSKVYIPGYGYAVAGDTGGAIKGKKIDVHMKTVAKAKKWGRKKVKIKVYK